MEAAQQNHIVAGACALAPPGILLTALNFPSIFYVNQVTRAATLVAVAASSISVITAVKIHNPSIAFMTGLLECWITIWASVLLIRFNPPSDFARLRWSKAPTKPTEYEADGKVWQKFPDKISLERLFWTLDLMISFRRVGWSFEQDKRVPAVQIPAADLMSTSQIRKEPRAAAEATQAQSSSGHLPGFAEGSLGLPRDPGCELDFSAP